MKMSEVRKYQVTGRITKPNLQTRFVREVLATKSIDAIEHIYTNIGSRHRVKRHHIKIDNVEEIEIEDVDN
jgi:large subunit ribosomal protein LX